MSPLKVALVTIGLVSETSAVSVTDSSPILIKRFAVSYMIITGKKKERTVKAKGRINQRSELVNQMVVSNK